MKVLNLQCAHQHSFEGWFGSEDDFQSQRARGLIECPMCADKDIQKMPSAPRLNLGGHPAQEVAEISNDKLGSALLAADQAGEVGTPPGANSAAQGAFLKALRHAVANTEDLGDRFAHEVRRMHYGDAESRSIRGKASLKETVELLEEGIDVMPLPPSIKETLQ
jgi:hypothetical protein